MIKRTWCSSYFQIENVFSNTNRKIASEINPNNNHSMIKLILAYLQVFHAFKESFFSGLQDFLAKRGSDSDSSPFGGGGGGGGISALGGSSEPEYGDYNETDAAIFG